MAGPIHFYFDFSSPYGYFAARRIDALAAENGRDALWHPVLLGAIFKITGARPLTDQPLRSEYFTLDIGRIARLTGEPFRLPDPFPINTVAASRAFYWLADDRPAEAKRLAAALYHHHWGLGEDISAPEKVVEIGASLGLDRAELAAALQDQGVKDRLRQATDQAVEKGVFGSPYFIVDEEPFWGWDRMDMLDRWLKTGGW